MALITQAQVELVLGASVVADLTGSDASVITELLDEASDWLQEYATGAGATLTSGTTTASLRRRAAIRFGYTAALRRQEYRDAQGRPPYHVEMEQAARELEQWAARIRPITTDTLAEAPVVLSEDPRGWNASTTDDE